MDAARHWACGGRQEERTKDEGDREFFREHGIDEEDIESVYGTAAEAEDDAFEVWPENWPSVQVFAALATQWQIAGGLLGSRVLGLHYPSIQTVMWAHQIRACDRRAMFDDMRVMEAAALNVMNKVQE